VVGVLLVVWFCVRMKLRRLRRKVYEEEEEEKGRQEDQDKMNLR
jgi:hypothetical protein